MRLWFKLREVQLSDASNTLINGNGQVSHKLLTNSIQILENSAKCLPFKENVS